MTIYRHWQHNGSPPFNRKLTSISSWRQLRYSSRDRLTNAIRNSYHRCQHHNNNRIPTNARNLSPKPRTSRNPLKLTIIASKYFLCASYYIFWFIVFRRTSSLYNLDYFTTLSPRNLGPHHRPVSALSSSWCKPHWRQQQNPQWSTNKPADLSVTGQSSSSCLPVVAKAERLKSNYRKQKKANTNPHDLVPKFEFRFFRKINAKAHTTDNPIRAINPKGTRKDRSHKMINPKRFFSSFHKNCDL